MYKNKVSIFDKYPLLSVWIIGFVLFLIILGLGIFQLNIKPSLDNLEKTSGTIIEYKKKTKYQDRYIILENNEKYYIYNESGWATDYSFDKELVEGYIVELQYINDKYKEVVSLKVNDKNLYSLEDYEIGFREYHDSLHILFMIVALLIIAGLLGITISFYKPINMNNKPKKIKDNFWSRLSPKNKVIIGVIIFILGFAYLPLCIWIFGKDEGITMDNHPFVFVSMLVVPLITFIISIVIIAKNEGLIKPAKNKFLQAINPKKENVYIEFVATIILSIMGIIGVVYLFIEEPEFKYTISCIGVLIVGLVGTIIYSRKIYKIRKDKKYYSKKDFVPKNVYEQLRNDLYKKQIRKQIRRLINDLEIDYDYDQELKQIKINFKNKLYEIAITIEKNNKWIDVILDNELETKLYEMAEQGLEKELTVDVLDKLLYDEEKVKLIFDKNDLSKTYLEIVNKIKEKQEYIEKLRELIL